MEIALCDSWLEKSVFQVETEDDALGSALKTALKKKRPGTITDDADDLELFLTIQGKNWLNIFSVPDVSLYEGVPCMNQADGNRVNFKHMIPGLYLRNNEHFGPGFKPEEGDVHVLVVIPENVVHKGLHLKTLNDIPQITLPENGYVTLPAALVDSCGLESDGDLMLYCRPRVCELWKFLREDVVEKNARGYVVGPPGAGKSACTLSFAVSLNRQEWNVVWIHLGRRSPDTCLVMNTRECWCVEDLSTFTLPRVDQRKLFVCLDGIVAEAEHLAFEKHVILHLRNEDRLVVCSSMATLDNTNEEDDRRAKIQYFFMNSWTQEEYLAAISNSAFYAMVVDKFKETSGCEVNDESDDDEMFEEKMHAFDLKFY